MPYVLMPQWGLQKEGRGARMDVMLGASAGCGEMPAAFWRPRGAAVRVAWVPCHAQRKREGGAGQPGG